MLTPDGAKVIDFGIAALAGTTNMDEHGTGGHTVPPGPERLLGGDVSPAADVYALGVLTYWLLAHQQPANQSGRDPARSPHAGPAAATANRRRAATRR